MRLLKGSSVGLCAALLLSLFLFQASLEAQDTATAKITSTQGIHVAEFTTAHGKIYVNLPDDMAKGDLVSGKLTLEPAGRTDKKKAKNLKSLMKYILDIGGKQSPAGKQWDKWNIPAVKELPIILRNSRGKAIASVRAAISRQASSPGGKTFGCDKTGLAGSFIQIKGPFDGDFSNTDLRIGDKALQKWVESPRRLLAVAPYDVIGSTTLSLSERDFKDQCPYRNLLLQSQVGKDKLLKGESTQMTITVRGLEGLDKPIPLHLENKTPAIVRMKQDETTITIQPGDVTPGGVYTCNRTITGIMPGNFRIRATIVSKDDCEKILKIYNQVKQQFNKQDKDCRKLAALVDALKRKKANAQKKRDKWKKELEDTKKDIKKNEDDLKKAKQKLKDLINFAIHSNEISTEPDPKLPNSIGLYGGEVRIYFSGSQTSINILSWFLNEYRDKWTKLRNECRKAARNLKDLQKKKQKAEKELNKAEQELKKAEEDLKEAEKKLKDCLKGKEALNNQLKDMADKYKRCLKRLEDQRECKSNIDDAGGAINGAGDAVKEAEDAIENANKDAGGLKNPSQKANDAMDRAKKLLEEAKELAEKAKTAQDEAEKAYNNGDLEKANKLAEEAKSLAEQAKQKAEEAKRKAEEAQAEIQRAKDAEERAAQREKERLQREKEWWDEFLSEDDPTPHDIRGGKKNLAIGIRNVIDEYIMDQISRANFGGVNCRDRCLIAVRNIFGEQYLQILKDIAWDVFWGSIQLPATITSTAVRLSFGVFKMLVGELVKSNHVIPLWGKHTYEHTVRSFKGFSVGNFKCEIESCLAYNKETGYVMGMVFCNCCGRTTTLYVKYKCDEYGRPMDNPRPRIEFR
jgi:septal ring factor EnvC (AmiA/AmiB activator)